jgi:copper transport protein
MSLIDPGVLSDVTADGVGLGVALAIAGSVLIVAALGRRPIAAAAGAVVAAGSFAATGHTRVGDTAALATLADLAHLEAAAVWGGGLVLLWLTLRARRQPASAGAAVAVAERVEATPAETASVVARFSRLATVSIVIVGAAGVALGWSEVRSLSALTSTGYGLFLLAKVAVVAAIAALGAYNHFRLVPAVQGRQSRAGLARLRHTLRLEALGLVAVLALTSVLVVMTPAKTSSQGGVVEKIVSLGDAGSVQLVVAPAKAGFTQVHIYTYDPTERPSDIAEAVTLELTLPEADLGPITRTPERAGPAHFQLDGDDFAVAGRWEIKILARIDRFTEASGTTEVDIAR